MSYLVIEKDDETGKIKIEAECSLTDNNILYIRHMIVEYITKNINPDCKKITFEWME